MNIATLNPVPTLGSQPYGQQQMAAPYTATLEPGQTISMAARGPAARDRHWIIDAINVSDERLKELLQTTRPLRFDWENKWLRGDQYAHMLNNIDIYRDAFNMHKMAEK